jgi:hypothetical protein
VRLARSESREKRKEGVMKGIYLIALAAGLMLLACGCAATSPTQAGGPISSSTGDARQTATRPAESSPRLQQQGFVVLDFRARRDEYDRVYVVGEVKNTGIAARGVELQATLRDAGGRLLAVGHFCPASHTNIVPDETWPFAYSFGRQEGAVQAELRIVGAFRTMDILGIASLAR